MLRQRLEGYFNSRWYGDTPPGPLWRALAAANQRVQAGRGVPPRDPHVPVIVVGNLTAGGGGKTPVVGAIVERLAATGFRPAIISRGYGGTIPRRPLRVDMSDDPAMTGDEPLLLARATGRPVWVCRDRAAALAAATEAGADVVVADDGLQHRSLPRSLEVCVIDGSRGFGNGMLLPAGPLRQPLSRLGLIDIVLIKRSPGSPVRAGLPGTAFDLVPGKCRRLADGAIRELSAFAGTACDAVCGIANPGSFFALLEAYGLSVRRHAFADHQPFHADALRRLKGPLLVTGKDAVKLEALEGLPETWVVPVSARLPEPVGEAIVSHVREFARS